MEKAEFYARSRDDLPGPLAGVRVLEATTTWAGPMCACVLADLGADVLKVELPGGEVVRGIGPFLPDTDPPVGFCHATVNRNKRTMTLDLRQDAGRQLFLRLAERSDIVVENFRPGTMARWGVGYEDLRAVKPDIVYVSVTGFGQFGPDHDRVAYDVLAQAKGGFLAQNGTPGDTGVKAPTFLADDLGGLHGAIGALAALAHRDRTGEGQHVDVGLLDALLYQSNGFLMLGALGLPNPRMGNEYAFIAPGNSFACKDGMVWVGVLLNPHWRVLAGLIGRSELADHPDYASPQARLERRAELNGLIAQWCAEQTVAQLLATCSEHSIPAAPLQSYADAARDPHVLARDMLQPVQHAEGGEAPIPGPAAKFSRTPTRVRTPAPPVGAHTAEVLGELGISAEEARRLREAGVV
jgi:formyl-CoA transferase